MYSSFGCDKREIAKERSSSMEKWICKTCGTQFPAGETPPPGCPICVDARQYVGHDGQQWTTLAMMQAEGSHNVVKEHEPGLIGIGTEPKFAIAQRALLVQTTQGNILWDCITLLDEQTAAQIESLGGIKAITISHPHYYTTMVEWAERFDAQILLHAADREWVMRKSPRIQFWEGGTMPLWDNLTLINCGGHFEGGTVLHWPACENGKGALLSGDIIQVVADGRYVRFMRRYPHLIPLG